MRITIIGGGPAGLYFAILMKKEYPSSTIVLHERNRPDDTFGWGVVFSGKTLSTLRRYDEDSWSAITSGFAYWENVNIVKDSTTISIQGNSFSGIARIEMLRILQARCRALGVELHFSSELVDFESEQRTSDIVVGADGVGSYVRSAYASAFEPSVKPASNKYIWYGTEKLFHGLTLTFRENTAGVFSAHSYKFNRERSTSHEMCSSTFIVECDEGTWRRAGLDTMEEPECRKYLEHVFASDLEGNSLLSNNSKWINFILVRNRHWWTENVVLLGDALHTAHFSIGSGTKLALEDSIALFEAVRSSGGIREALAKFEEVRKPEIEAYQSAAEESMGWFERVSEKMPLPPLEFAYACMLRSRKFDPEHLRLRDPAFVASLEAAGLLT